MVVWIEIIINTMSRLLKLVTTCVVVWIEIPVKNLVSISNVVTTCVVVWIEIFLSHLPGSTYYRHHLRGGVD